MEPGRSFVKTRTFVKIRAVTQNHVEDDRDGGNSYAMDSLKRYRKMLKKASTSS